MVKHLPILESDILSLISRQQLGFPYQVQCLLLANVYIFRMNCSLNVTFRLLIRGGF